MSRPRASSVLILILFSVATHFADRATAQQVGTLDLRQLAPFTSAPPSHDDDPSRVPGCDKLSLGYADGYTEPPDHKMRSIDVSVVEISATRLIINSEVEGTIKLQNTGDLLVRIPWSTDFKTIIRGQDPRHLSWESGEFHLKLKSKDRRGFELANLSLILYSSRLVPESEMTIGPGQWITAQIRFKVNTPNLWERVEEGDFNLSAEWFQTERGRNVQGCSGSQGFFPFRNYYKENHTEIPVTVVDVPETRN